MTAAFHAARFRGLALAATIIFGVSTPIGTAPEGQAGVWPLLLQPGHTVLMRHADAPGGAGDPPQFRLDDCATQRNLSEAGRAQAKRTRDAFKKHGIAFVRLLTSPWCRCRETAQLVTGREAETFDALGNLVGRYENAPGQVKALKLFLAANREPALLVTHGIVINALVGINPAQGEMVIVKLAGDGEPAVAGRLRVD
jgi:phosphohistidine phosphatase SixA